jgi:hypothetical protein
MKGCRPESTLFIVSRGILLIYKLALGEGRHASAKVRDLMAIAACKGRQS